MKKLSDIQSAVLNEDEKYRADIKNMLDVLHAMAKKSMEDKPVDAVINIAISSAGVNDTKLEVPFNADSYERLVTFLDEESKEDEELEGISDE